jgi:hypothetical protein
MKKLTVITFAVFLCNFNIAHGQIEIRQDATQIKSFIEASTIDHNRYDSYGNRASSIWTWDVKYYNGEIIDVIQCCPNQYLIDFEAIVSFCKHYVMEKGKLTYVLTQYEEISVENLKKFYDKSYSEYRDNEIYFSEDYKHYSRIYLSKNGYATVEWRQYESSQLPIGIQRKIDRKQEIAKKRNQEEEERNQRENEIKSKIYDLADYDSSKYNSFVNNLCILLCDKLKTNPSFPNWSEIVTYPQKYFSFKNSYSANYKLVDNIESISSNSIGHVFRNTEQFTLLSGTDNSFSFIKSVAPPLPKIYIKGITVGPEATIIGLSISYTKGITNVKIKNGLITYKKFPPSEDMQHMLSEKLKTENNGTYYIKYEVGNVMSQSFITIEKQ